MEGTIILVDVLLVLSEQLCWYVGDGGEIDENDTLTLAIASRIAKDIKNTSRYYTWLSTMNSSCLVDLSMQVFQEQSYMVAR
jgi:hypothetical protein